MWAHRRTHLQAERQSTREKACCWAIWWFSNRGPMLYGMLKCSQNSNIKRTQVEKRRNRWNWEYAKKFTQDLNNAKQCQTCKQKYIQRKVKMHVISVYNQYFEHILYACTKKNQHQIYLWKCNCFSIFLFLTSVRKEPYQAEMCQRKTIQAADPRDLVVCQAEMGKSATMLKTSDLTETVVWARTG